MVGYWKEHKDNFTGFLSTLHRLHSLAHFNPRSLVAKRGPFETHWKCENAYTSIPHCSKTHA